MRESPRASQPNLRLQATVGKGSPRTQTVRARPPRLNRIVSRTRS